MRRHENKSESLEEGKDAGNSLSSFTKEVSPGFDGSLGDPKEYLKKAIDEENNEKIKENILKLEDNLKLMADNYEIIQENFRAIEENEKKKFDEISERKNYSNEL